MEQTELKAFCMDTGLTRCLPLPRELLRMELPATAMLLYAALLDRATLSRKNRYADEEGRVFVIYPIEKLAQTLSISETAVKRHLKTLEDRGLIRRMRPKRNGPSRIFLSLPAGSIQAGGTGWERPPQGEKTGGAAARKRPVNNRRKLIDPSDYYQRGEDESL